ncbi:MAG TPA: L,D-transpeptidase family protein, partial [Alphaproteobacteria bacterium]|nr:L,D-transpeptidase family protein [Alphaproteobacteria bacterium]
AKKVFELIRDANTHGMNPENYYRSQLSQMIEGNFSTETHAINAELLLTASVVRYGGDISGMRVSPKAAGEDYSSWSKGVFAESLLTVLSGSSDPENVLEMLAPQDETYKALREELKDTLEQYAQDAKTRNTQIPYAGMVRPGQSGSIVPYLRKRFDLVDQDNPIYDEIVEQAVIDFQKSHGLKPDGIVGPRTIRSINEGPRDRIVKILANLERRRWIRRPMPSRFVEVNIPAMWLRAVEDNKTVFDMPVIIGRKKRETMSFVDEIVGVRFNPSWYVPSTIKKEDYLPKLREDPQALAEKGISFRVRDENGGGMVDVLPEDIDWSQVTERDLKAIQMVQGPGAANALGQIRVLMPNKYDIYLHDTNAPGLFRKDDRAQSSGCVRLSEPRRIAGFILGKNKKWSDDRLDYYLSKGKTLEIVAEQRVPVYLFYLTIWKNESGELVYGQDIYGRDEDLIKLLKNNGQIDFPMI